MGQRVGRWDRGCEYQRCKGGTEGAKVGQRVWEWDRVCEVGTEGVRVGQRV